MPQTLCQRNHPVTYKKGDRIDKVLVWRKKKRFAEMVPGHLCPTCIANDRLYKPYTDEEI